MPDDGPRGPKHVAIIDDIIKSLLYLTVIYMPTLMSQHNRMDSIREKQVGENWKRYIKELMQLFGDLDILQFVRTSRLNLIGSINRMDSKRSQVFNNNPQGIRLGGGPKNR